MCPRSWYHNTPATQQVVNINTLVVKLSSDYVCREPNGTGTLVAATAYPVVYTGVQCTLYKLPSLFSRAENKQPTAVSIISIVVVGLAWRGVRRSTLPKPPLSAAAVPRIVLSRPSLLRRRSVSFSLSATCSTTRTTAAVVVRVARCCCRSGGFGDRVLRGAYFDVRTPPHNPPPGRRSRFDVPVQCASALVAVWVVSCCRGSLYHTCCLPWGTPRQQ